MIFFILYMEVVCSSHKLVVWSYLQIRYTFTGCLSTPSQSPPSHVWYHLSDTPGGSKHFQLFLTGLTKTAYHLRLKKPAVNKSTGGDQPTWFNLPLGFSNKHSDLPLQREKRSTNASQILTPSLSPKNKQEFTRLDIWHRQSKRATTETVVLHKASVCFCVHVYYMC